MTDELRYVPGYGKRYGVTRDGRVYAYPTPPGAMGRHHNGRWLLIRPTRKGEPTVQLCMNGEEKRVRPLEIAQQVWAGPDCGPSGDDFLSAHSARAAKKRAKAVKPAPSNDPPVPVELRRHYAGAIRTLSGWG